MHLLAQKLKQNKCNWWCDSPGVQLFRAANKTGEILSSFRKNSFELIRLLYKQIQFTLSLLGLYAVVSLCGAVHQIYHFSVRL